MNNYTGLISIQSYQNDFFIEAVEKYNKKICDNVTIEQDHEPPIGEGLIRYKIKCHFLCDMFWIGVYFNEILNQKKP